MTMLACIDKGRYYTKIDNKISTLKTKLAHIQNQHVNTRKSFGANFIDIFKPKTVFQYFLLC